MKPEIYDFSGWATRNDIRCSDGRTILRDAFAHQDGEWVPLVWGHIHDNPENTIGKIYLENRREGVYGYGQFNDNERAKASKEALRHGDVNRLSIFANHLTQDSSRNVQHGDIKEVSLVLSGANPGAVIDFVLAHSEDNSEDETSAIIYSPIEHLEQPEANIKHADEKKEPEMVEEKKSENPAENEGAQGGDVTVGEAFNAVLNKLSKEEQDVIYAVIGMLAENSNTKHDDMEDTEMKHNAFDTQNINEEETLTHDDMKQIFAEAYRCGSLKDAVNRADDYLSHSISNIDSFFPDAQPAPGMPVTIDRDQAWVSVFMNATNKVPFARVKMFGFDITADDARAKGYVKGNQKIEEVVASLKRSTDPTTIYKLQKLDRDDLLDITDFDAVAYLKKEMSGKLDEELARAALVGDGRSTLSTEKIPETNIRPIWTDTDVYTIKEALEFTEADTDTTKLKKFIKACVKARKNYKGSGNPTLFTTEDMLADLLLMDDGIGRPLYKDAGEVAKALRVSNIVTVPVMEGLTRKNNTDTYTLQGIIVNPKDYTFGNNKNGEKTMFDDFDIEYNKYRYLIETRKSGALTMPYSAIVIETKTVNG